MANSNKNLVITPNIGSANDPNIVFSGADASTAAQNITLTAYPTNGGTLSFDGSAGQLFSVTNSMSGTIFSANDVSGIPSLEILDTGLVKIAQYSGNVLLGTSTDTGLAKLQIVGSVSLTGNILHSPTGRSIYGPNPTWSSYLYVGGDGVNSITRTASIASIVTTNGNVHIDSGSDKAIYLNYYSGTGGIQFGNGATGVTATLSAAGIFTATADVRAPIFYDSNDTAYYLNPNATSNLNAATFAGAVTSSGKITGQLLGISGGGSNIAGTIYSDANWGMIFTALQASPNNADFLFLNSAGVERARITSTTATFAGAVSIAGDLTVGNGTSSRIYMSDTDEGTRQIHCNSNRIGFLDQSGNWGAYCDDSGNWFATNLSGTNTGDQTVGNGALTLAVSGTGLSGSASFSANQSGASTFTVTSNATGANTASTIVARDGLGNFSAGTITAGSNAGISIGANQTSKGSLYQSSSGGTILKMAAGSVLGFIVEGTLGQTVFTQALGGTLSINPDGYTTTFGGSVSASNLSGTNTGDQTNISGNAATATTSQYVVNNVDGAVIVQSNTSEANNWLWKEAVKQWGIYWFNTGSQSGQTIGTYTTIGAETMFMGGSGGIAMPAGWTGYQSGSYIAAMISSYTGYIYSASTIYAATQMLVGGNVVLHAGNYTSYSPAISYSRFAGDINTLGVSNATSGIYNIGTGYTNGPTAALYGTLQAYWNSDIGVQFWHSYNGDSYWRKSVASTFSGAAWRTNLDSVNYTSYSMPAGSSATNSVDVRAPIFYDSNNTAYYCDPAGTSIVNRITARASGVSLSTGNSSQLEISNAASGACNISFHRESSYGAHFGLDTDNVFSTLGWSAGAGYTGMRVGAFTANGTFAVNNGWSYVANNYGYGIVGLYNATVFQLVFAMGDAYKTTAGGGISNLYGIAWSHPNAGGIAANLSTHGALFTENGAFMAAISGSIRCRDDMRAPLYYDSANTAYYLDPASTGNSLLVAGSVGIGTTSPQSSLHIFKAEGGIGTKDATITLGGYYSQGATIASYRYEGDSNSRGLMFSTRNTGVGMVDAVTITGPGNVGIGTTSPAEKMEISGGKLKITSSGYGWIYANDTNHSIIIRGDRDGTAADYTNHYQYGGTLANGKGHKFWTGGVLASQTLKIQIADDGTYIAGSLGIGTTSPVGNLDVTTSGTGGWSKFVVTSSSLWGDGSTQYVTIGAGSGVTGIMINNPHVVWNAGNAGAAIRMGRSGGVSGGAYYDIGTRASDAWSIQKNASETGLFYINSAGNVGIGTASPSQKLEVGNFLDAVTNKITVSARHEYEPEFNFRLGQSGTGYDWIGAVISSGDDGNYNGKISFKTANAGRDTPTTKMVIKASGNVGIGTTSPSVKLAVVGSATIGSVYNTAAGTNAVSFGEVTTASGINSFAIGYYSTASNYHSFAAGYSSTASGHTGIAIGYLATAGGNGNTPIAIGRFVTANGENMVLGRGFDASNPLVNTGTNSIMMGAGSNLPTLYIGAASGVGTTGNVGIGTTTPGSKLSVAQDMSMGADLVDNTAQMVIQGTTTPGKKLMLGYDTNGNGFGFIKAGNLGVAWTNLALQPNSGSVSIGATSAVYKLDVNGVAYASSDFRAPIFYDSANTGYYCDPASTSNLNALVLSGASYFRPQNWIQMDGSYGMYWPNTNGCHIEGNTLSSYGSLAIRGTRNGWYGIHFYGGGNTPHLMFDGSANGGVYYESTGRWASYYSHSNNCWAFGTSTTSSAYNLYAPTGIYSGGRVDGTIFYDSNNTTYYLDPASTSNLNAANFAGAVATGNLTVTGAITATGNITAYYSDDRLKTKLGLISDPIEKVKSLSGFYFEANETAVALGYTKQREVGVSAQEVQAILPEIIAPAPIDAQYMTVRYEKLIPLLVEAIKAQQVQIEELKAHITIIQQNLNNK